MMFPLGFLSIFAVYLTTLYPHIAPEDSGEFVAAAWTLGIPHASGYSLYVLLGRAAVAMIPLGNPAYRVNVLSALLGVGTALVFADILKRLLPEPTAARDLLGEIEKKRWRETSLWAGTLLLALVPGFWYLSLLAEVYILQIFLVTLCLWSVVRAAEPDARSRSVFLPRVGLSGYLFGLAAGVHHTAVLWAPGLLGFWRGRNVRFRKPLAAHGVGAAAGAWWRDEGRDALCWAALLAAAGFSVQVFLALRSNAAPLLDTGAPDTWERFWRVILRRDYGTFSLAQDAGGASRLDGLATYASYLLQAFTPIGPLFLLFGAWRALRQSPAAARAVLLLWALSGPFFVWLAAPPRQAHFQGVMERFYPFSLVALAILTAWGLYEAGLLRPWAKRLGLLLIPLSFFTHLHVSGRGNLHARDFGVNLLKSMPAGAVLWDPGDTAAYSVLYLQDVQKVRRDVASVLYHTTLWGQQALRRRFPDLLGPGPAGETPGFVRDFLARLLAGPRKAWIFTEVPKSLPGLRPTDGLPFQSRYPEDALPLGLAYRFFPAAAHKLVEPFSQLSLARLTFSWYRRTTGGRLRAEASTAAPFWDLPFHDRFTEEVLRRYAEARTNLGQKFAQHGFDGAAEQEYQTALAADPGQLEAFNNLGVLAYDRRRFDHAAFFFRKALARDPSSVSLHQNLGQAFLAADRLDAALDVYRAAARLAPDAPALLRDEAEILSRLGRHAEALPLWETLRLKLSDDKTVFWRLVETYAALRRTDKAVAALGEYFLFPLTDSEKSAAEDFRRALVRVDK